MGKKQQSFYFLLVTDFTPSSINILPLLVVFLVAPYLLYLTCFIISLDRWDFYFFNGGISAEAESLCCRLDALLPYGRTFSSSVNRVSASLCALFILVILLLNLQVGN